MKAHRRLAVVTSLLVSVVSCGERPESWYPTIEAARQAGAITRGWVPAALPDTASDIHERHDIDTNEIWGTFAFRGSQPPGVTEVPIEELAGRRIRSGGIGGWPVVLSGPLDPKALRESGLKFYKTIDRGILFIALDYQQGRGFFWSPS